MSLKSQYHSMLDVEGSKYVIYDLNKIAASFNLEIEKLPYSLRILLENVVRNDFSEKNIENFKKWLQDKSSNEEVNFMPTRVLMQDFTGVPAVVDLASMRDAMNKLSGNPDKINPLIPVDLIIDHSLQVDYFGNNHSFDKNVQKEIERNLERYQFLKWGQNSFKNFRVVPPGTGICHQVNLEYLAKTIYVNEDEEELVAYPDSLVGTDSHTTMINSLSVLGWGVGGIEAEAAMLGQPLPMILPEVIGVKLTGKISEMATATDLVLTITEILRKKGVVGKFVEYYGDGLKYLSLADRATIANMSPEYGATCGFFPTDIETLKYLSFTGRDEHHVKLVEKYTREQKLWYQDSTEAVYTDVIELDMSSIKSSVAGPKRPQDRIDLSELGHQFNNSIEEDLTKQYLVENKNYNIKNGDVVIAAITSCTNTSNPSVMLQAGLIAKKANELGLNVKPWVKTSLAPGSKVVTESLKKSGLSKDLDNLGFNLVGYGCTTCIGNSGPLDADIEKTIQENDLTVVGILSGNRNFEGRIHPLTKNNYLASPPLVVMYALAGTININVDNDPIATNDKGEKIYFKDLWPTNEEVESYIEKCLSPEMFVEKYSDVFTGDKYWQSINTLDSKIYNWQYDSTYINNPPYFDNIESNSNDVNNIQNARLLAVFGDTITTDHISPAGVISSNSPAARFLAENGVEPRDFNSYGSRRGNHEVMMRGTFANIRIKNLMCLGEEGGYTIDHLTGEKTNIYDAAMQYKLHEIPLVIFAGKEYGTGSSRDWAAKGTKLLGVKAVIAESFERIHRSNLIGMGVLPIALSDSVFCKDLNLKGNEIIDIIGIHNNMQPLQELKCIIKKENDELNTLDVTLQVYTEREMEYIRNGGILNAVLRELNS